MSVFNPFSTEYLEQEIQFYAPKEYEKNGIRCVLKPIEGFNRIDEFFNKGFWSSGPDIPMLLIDGVIWMSLTWQEVQSQWVPIRRATGRVLIGGLGMGYVALRIAAKPDVEKVVVYEIDERVIEFFKATKGNREEVKKIEIVKDDIRKAEGKFDFAFIDTYPTLLDNRTLSDVEFFMANNRLQVSGWHFWGQELAYLTAMGLSSCIKRKDTQGELYRHFAASGKVGLINLVPDVDWCWDLVEALGALEGVDGQT